MNEPGRDPVRDEQLNVFVPGLMGVGILVSGALVIGDWMRRMLPAGGVRRQQRLALGAQGIVMGAARAAGYRVTAPDLDRRHLRARWIYFAFTAIAVGVGVLSVRTGVRMFTDETGLLYENPWAVGLGFGFGIGFFVIGLASLLPGILYRRRPLPVQLLAEMTWLGRIRVPPSGYHKDFIVTPATSEEEMSR